jgi:hypothetical protein
VNGIKVGNKEVVGERHAHREPRAVCEEEGTWLTEEKPICVSRRRCRLAGRGVTKETVLGGSYGINGWLDG